MVKSYRAGSNYGALTPCLQTSRNQKYSMQRALRHNSQSLMFQYLTRYQTAHTSGQHNLCKARKDRIALPHSLSVSQLYGVRSKLVLSQSP